MVTIDRSELIAYLHCALGLASFSSKILAALRLIDGSIICAWFVVFNLFVRICCCAEGEIKLPS
jgi:hypothetical protein